MSDVELLFLVLALIYVWECLAWTPTGATAFVSWRERTWARRSPFLSNQRGGVVFAPLIPPLGCVFLCHPNPVRFSIDGISRADVAEPARSAVISFADIKKVEAEGKKLLVNSKLFARTGSATMTAKLAARIREFVKLKPAERERSLQALNDQKFNLRTIEERWKHFLHRTNQLWWLTNALFLYLFVAAPFVIWRFGFALSWLPLLIGLYLLTFSIAFLFRRVHAHFFPDAASERFTHVLINMFSPATTIRARDHLARSVLEDFHFLAVAKLFCAESDFKRIARAALLDLTCRSRTPSTRVPDEQSASLNIFLTKQGLKPEELLRPPKPADDSCRSYCPRCQSQFTLVEGICHDCGGLPLIAFTVR